MSRAPRHAVRFLMVIAVVAALHAALAPSLPVNSPYLSALSDITGGAVMAIPINCPNNACGGKKGCRSDHGFYCTIDAAGGCSNSKCL